MVKEVHPSGSVVQDGCDGDNISDDDHGSEVTEKCESIKC